MAQSNNKAEEKEETLLEWSVHLFKREKRYRSILATVAVVTALVGGWVLIRDPLVVAVYALIIFFALGGFFFPVKYRVTDKGVYSFAWTGPRFMPWDRIKRCYKNEHGVKLSVFEYPSPMESFRGLFIRFGDKRDEVLSLVKRLAQGRSTGAS
jgi:hypothetical protein